MKTTQLLISILALAVLLVGCSNPPMVFQGTVQSVDPQAQTISAADENAPHEILTFYVQHAEMGAEAKPGDLVRIAYKVESGNHHATRVMNLTRQDELRDSVKKH